MKKYVKIMGIALALILMAGLSTKNVYAAGSIDASVDKTSCANGDKVSVTIEAEADEGQTKPPQITIEYNPNRLNFDNCSVEYGGGGGGLVTINDTSATIDFTTLSGGEAKVSITAVLDDDSTNVQQAEVLVIVDGDDTAAGTDDIQSAATGVSEGTISSGDGCVVQMVFAEEFMPPLFHKGTVQYQNQAVECAQYDMADVTLLYTTAEDGSDGKFKIYDAATGNLSDFRTIQGIENKFIIILGEDVAEVPYGYTKANLDWNGRALTAYVDMNTINGTVTTFNDINAADFFLIYGMSSEGVKGWYQYDKVDGTYQRFLQITSNIANTAEMAEDDDGDKDTEGIAFLDGFLSRKLQGILLLVFAGLVLLLLIVVIILAIKCAEYNDYEYVDPEEYYSKQSVNRVKNVKNVAEASDVGDDDDSDDEDDNDEETSDENDSSKLNTSAEGKVSVGRGEEDEEDDDSEDDEEDEDDEESEDDYFAPRMSKREMREREKQIRREEREAAKDEKWRLKEEKKAARMRERGYEEAQPMDWSTFGDTDENDSRRPTGRGNAPAYMRAEADNIDNSEVEQTEMIEMAEEREVSTRRQAPEPEEQKLPPRRPNPAYTAEREAESARARKEEEMRMRQKYLFEQQQRIEEQRRIEQEQLARKQREEQEKLARKQREEQEKYVLSQRDADEDLDEDFQFEFLKL